MSDLDIELVAAIYLFMQRIHNGYASEQMTGGDMLAEMQVFVEKQKHWLKRKEQI